MKLHQGSFQPPRLVELMPSPQLLPFSRLQVSELKTIGPDIIRLTFIILFLLFWVNILKVISFPIGLSVPGIPSALASLGVGHSSMAAAAAAASRLGLSGLAAAGGHNVLLVSNLNPEVSTLTGRKPVCILSLFLQC